MDFYGKCIRTIILSFFILSLLFSSSVAQKNDNSSEIEIQKSKLELEQLTYEQQFFQLSFWIKTLGVLLGGIAVIWTIVYGLKTISESSKERTNSKVSSLLQSLSSNFEYERWASARGLAPYIDKVTDEMLTAISIEKSDGVRNAMENSLSQVKKNNMKKVININSETLRKRSYLYGCLIKLGIKQEEMAARCRLSTESIKMIIEEFHVDYDYGKKIQELLMKRKEIIEGNQNDLNKCSDEFLFNESKIVSQQAESTGKVIAKWIVEGNEISWPDTGLDLSETNLYKAKLQKIKASYSIFSFCIMRHSNLESSILDNSIFISADLFDTCLDNVHLHKANLIKCNLRQTSGKKADFSKSVLNDAVFSESIYSGANFEGATGTQVQFRGTDLRNAIFNNCNLTKSEFQNANLEGATLNEAKMCSSKFISANFNNASMRGAFFNGADLLGAKFSNADLQNADFRGANIKKADFRGANTKNVKFENCKGFNEAIFDNNLSSS